MYELARSVTSCLGAGTAVDIAWLVDVRGLDYRAAGDAGNALVFTPGGGRIGSILAGALDEELASSATLGAPGRLVEAPITDFAALLAGLPVPAPGAAARCLVMPAAELPPELWSRLLAREPLCLLIELAGKWTGKSMLFSRESIGEAGDDAARLFARGTTATEIIDGTAITVLWPVPRLILVGGGPMVDALEVAARLVGWAPQRINDVDEVRHVPELSATDGIVVAAHDVEFAGAALVNALAGGAGYVGALGSRAMQQTRRQWLSDHGVDDTGRINSPAGLDIGARKPGEVAVAIVAQMLAATREAR